LQFGVLRLGLLEYRDVGVRISPQREKVRVGSLRFGHISRESERTAQLQPRHCAYWIAEQEASMIEDLLEFGDCFSALPRSEIGFSSYISWVEAAVGRN
jgi:hypothetical protein